MLVSGHLWTLRRQVKDWRRLEACQLILADPLECRVSPDVARDGFNRVDRVFLSGRLGKDGATNVIPLLRRAGPRRRIGAGVRKPSLKRRLQPGEDGASIRSFDDVSASLPLPPGELQPHSAGLPDRR